MKKLILTITLVGLMAMPALAEPTLQEALNSITLAPTPGLSSVNVATDTITDGLDSFWTMTGGATASTMMFEFAGNAPVNTFGVFDMTNSAITQQIFAGGNVPGDSALMSIKADGSILINNVDLGVDFAGNAFGFYIGTPTGTFFSDTLLNSDGVDHMWALQGKGDTIQIPTLITSTWESNEYVLGWEDTLGGGDFDHQDMVVMVESVRTISPVIPAPGAILLGSIGVCLVGWLKRRRIV